MFQQQHSSAYSIQLWEGGQTPWAVTGLPGADTQDTGWREAMVTQRRALSCSVTLNLLIRMGIIIHTPYIQHPHVPRFVGIREPGVCFCRECTTFVWIEIRGISMNLPSHRKGIWKQLYQSPIISAERVGAAPWKMPFKTLLFLWKAAGIARQIIFQKCSRISYGY